jgi:hypothetical protein
VALCHFRTASSLWSLRGCCGTRQFLLRKNLDSDNPRRKPPEATTDLSRGLTVRKWQSATTPRECHLNSYFKISLIIPVSLYLRSFSHTRHEASSTIPLRNNQATLSCASYFGVFCEDCLSPNFLQRKKWSSSTAAEIAGAAVVFSKGYGGTCRRSSNLQVNARHKPHEPNSQTA